MKRILVPCDFSEPAVNAFRFAIDIARKSESEIVLLHVMESSVTYDTKHMSALSFEEKANLKAAKDGVEKNLDRLIAKWANEGPQISRQVEFGMIAKTINNFANKKEVELIVMGTKGCATGFKEIIVGSITEKIMHSSAVPVIAIKKYVKTQIKNIVFANSLVEDSEELVKKVTALQDLFGATLHMVYVNSPGRSLLEREIRLRLDTFAKRWMLKNCTITIYNDIDPESGLMNFAKEVKADMVAMATHGLNGLARIFNTSIAGHVRYHMDCPFWTFKI